MPIPPDLVGHITEEDWESVVKAMNGSRAEAEAKAAAFLRGVGYGAQEPANNTNNNPPPPNNNDPPKPTPRPPTPDNSGQQRRPRQQPSQPLPQFPLEQSLAEAERRLEILLRHYQAGGHPDTPISKELSKQAKMAEKDVARHLVGMSEERHKEVRPEIDKLESRRRKVEEQEIHRRERLNQELTRGQYAVAEFAANLAGGHAGAALGALAGGLSGIQGVIASTIVAILGQTFSRFRENVRYGGEVLSPTLADTRNQSEAYRNLLLARQQGETESMTQEARRLQREGQAIDAGLHPAVTWLNAFNEKSWRAGASSFFQTFSLSKANAAREQSLAEQYEGVIREHGREPRPMLRNMDLPGVQANVGSAMEYQTQLQMNGLQRQDLNNEILQAQLQHLLEIGSLLQEIRSNTNGLENLRPQWVP